MSPEEKKRHKENTKKYNEKNPEVARESSRRYYHANKEKSNARNKAWREHNREYVIAKQREDKRKRKLEAIEYLGGYCTRCGGTFHPSVYEFHHTNPDEKDRDPSKMLQLRREILFSELDKCQLLCANCHRFIHHGDKY